jgi:hypothetical protein
MDEINKLLIKYDSEITCNSSFDDYKITRRGFCGQINIDIVFPNLIRDLHLEKIDIILRSSKPLDLVDIYKYNDLYIKRLCICDTLCGESLCSKNKIKNTCDGHHTIVISSSPDLNINDETDYVIDFTYKQMLINHDDEENIVKLAEIEKLPKYLFMKLKDYLKYSTVQRWQDNITNPCRFIINNYNEIKAEIKGGYYIKYLKYKQKYIALKVQSNFV